MKILGFTPPPLTFHNAYLQHFTVDATLETVAFRTYIYSNCTALRGATYTLRPEHYSENRNSVRGEAFCIRPPNLPPNPCLSRLISGRAVRGN